MTTKKPINEGYTRGTIKENGGIAKDGSLKNPPSTQRPPPPPAPKPRKSS